jgi:uncharacterized glyoxalase superfamily protein PhnB
MAIKTVTSEVVVAVDPAVAFHAFTEEMDLWWRRGPINFYSDGGRVVEVRCEPGVGGRIVEVLDDRSAGDVFERARITLWEPPSRLGWSSAVDDVDTEVRFAAVDGGTRVTVEHRIPDGGEDRGGTAWSRVVPKWFRTWCAGRDRVPHEQFDIARVSVAVSYERPAAAARWLRDVFALTPDGDLPEVEDPLPRGEHGIPWIEFRVGNSVINVFDLGRARGDATSVHDVWVYVDDVAAHFEHAKRNGAAIVEELHALPSSMYTALDLEGNRWVFAQARPTMR